MINSYNSYKKAKINWFKEVPTHWIIARLSYYAEVIGGSTPKSSNESYWNGNVHWVTTDDLGKLEGKVIKKTRRTITKDGLANCSASLLPKKSVVISSRAPIGHLGILAIDAATNQGCKGLVPIDNKIDSKFLYYYLLASKTDLQSLGSGSTFTEISSSTLKSYNIVIPELDEQVKIGEYLDHQTRLIDAIIEKKQVLIEKLKEQRQAIISEAVTKGLNPDAPMKDSGVEWLGEIPEHWEISKLKYLLSENLKYGANESALETNSNHPRYIRITDFGNDGKLKNNTFRSLPPEVAEGYLLEEGDILFARSGATVGKTFQFKDYKGKACFAGYLIKASVNKKMLSDYLYLFTKSGIYENWKNSIFIQATIQNISAEKYNNLRVTIPPKDEQQIIIDAVYNKTSSIDLIINKIQNQINKLLEFRQSIISEAVTGKIDVREWEPQVKETV